jgi:DNA repair protein RadC
MKNTDGNEIFEVAEVQLIYKSKVKPSLRPKVLTPSQAANVFRKYWDPDKIELVEQFKILLVNRTKRVLGIYEVATGTTTDVMCDVRLVLIAALRANATGIMIAHNHPSGSLELSEKDFQFTNTLRIAARFLQISLLDHIILTRESYFSFADRGIL